MSRLTWGTINVSSMNPIEDLTALFAAGVLFNLTNPDRARTAPNRFAIPCQSWPLIVATGYSKECPSNKYIVQCQRQNFDSSSGGGQNYDSSYNPYYDIFPFMFTWWLFSRGNGMDWDHHINDSCIYSHDGSDASSVDASATDFANMDICNTGVIDTGTGSGADASCDAGGGIADIGGACGACGSGAGGTCGSGCDAGGSSTLDFSSGGGFDSSCGDATGSSTCGTSGGSSCGGSGSSTCGSSGGSSCGGSASSSCGSSGGSSSCGSSGGSSCGSS